MLTSPGSKAFKRGNQRTGVYMTPDFKAGYFPCYFGPALRELKSKSAVSPLEEVQHFRDQIFRQISPGLRTVAGSVSE